MRVGWRDKALLVCFPQKRRAAITFWVSGATSPLHHQLVVRKDPVLSKSAGDLGEDSLLSPKIMPEYSQILCELVPVFGFQSASDIGHELIKATSKSLLLI